MTVSQTCQAYGADTPSSTDTAPAVPDVAKNVLRAFQYCLDSKTMNAHMGMDLATLMLELASLHQYGSLQQKNPELATAVSLHLSECRQRIEQLSDALGLNMVADTKEANQ